MVVGQVIRSEESCFLWTIDDFLSRVWVNDYEVESPRFCFFDRLYYLGIHYDSRNWKSIKLSFYTKRVEPPCEMLKLFVKLGMKTGYKGKIETRSGGTDTYGYFSVTVWMPCSEFLDRRSEILSDGRLIIFCELRPFFQEIATGLQVKRPSEGEVSEVKEPSDSDSGEDEANIDWKTVRRMRKDFGKMLVSGEDSDVTIKVRDKEFRAHRNILRARSPVFNSMFTHDTEERQSGVVSIEDCDPVTFPAFLRYIYTGSTKHICDANVCQLYAGADKYGVDELKQLCAEFMKDNLSVGKFCDIITLAAQHNERELIDSATEFFCENAREITLTSKWQTFLHENTTVGNELFIKLLASGKK